MYCTTTYHSSLLVTHSGKQEIDIERFAGPGELGHSLQSRKDAVVEAVSPAARVDASKQGVILFWHKL
jgi:hypothetical protein